MTRLKVLLADDQRDSLELLAELLSLYSVETRMAQSGGEAIRLALKWEPDILITDIEMPEMDGRHLASRLKLSLPAMVAIAVSGTSLTTDFSSSADLVFDHYFVKPIDFPRLHAILTQYVDKAKGADATT